MSMTFGQTLYQRRMWLGLSAAATAQRLELQPDTYRNWENGKHTPHALMQRGAISMLDDLAREHAHAVLTELSTGTFQGCSPRCSQATCGPLDTNTRSSTGAN